MAALLLCIVVAMSYIISIDAPSLGAGVQPVELGRVLDEVRQGRVKSAVLQGDRLYATLRDGRRLSANANEAGMEAYLYDRGIALARASRPLVTWQGTGAALLLMCALYLGLRWIADQIRSAAPDTRLRHPYFRMVDEANNDYTFSGVSGHQEAKSTLTDVALYLRDPQRFQKLGGKIAQQHMLIIGPPGTGKTLLADAVGGESKVPFFKASGAQFVELAAGGGRLAVERLFEQLKKSAPCILHFERIDLLKSLSDAGNRETLASLISALSEPIMGCFMLFEARSLDGVDPMLLPVLDSATRLVTRIPDPREREQILNVHMRKIPIGHDVSAVHLARMTAGSSGADLSEVINAGALIAAKTNAHVVGQAHLNQAVIEWRLGGLDDMPAPDDAASRRHAAAYAAGQVLVARRLGLLSDEAFVRIGSRANTFLPEPAATTTKNEVFGLVAAMLAGRAAQALSPDGVQTVLGQEDLRDATALAERAVRQLGFAPGLGPRAFEPAGTTVREAPSPELARKVDRAISDLLETALAEARRLLSEDLRGRELVAARLAEHGFIYGYMVGPLLIEGVFDLNLPVVDQPPAPVG